MNSYLKVVKFTFGLIKIVDLANKEDAEKLSISARKFELLIQELGPTYTKLGQILSLRYDLLPKSVCDVLHDLLDSEIAIPYIFIKKILKAELKTNFSEFKTIQKQPIAVASIGQVHIGYLNSGEKVAIKIQKPMIRETLLKDLKAFYSLIRILSIIPQIRKLRIKKALHEFEMWTLKELDFKNEARNTMEFKKIFSEDKYIYTPKVYGNISTNKVLVTEFIEGISLKDAIETFNNSFEDNIIINKISLSKKKLLEMFKKTIFKQVFKVGFLHGDPHPSNIIIKDSKTICFIDFGLVAELTHDQQEIFKRLVFNTVENNREDVVKGFIAMDTIPGSQREEIILNKLTPYFEKLARSASLEYSPTHFILDSIFKLTQLGIEPPMFIILLAKVLAIYDGMFLSIEPKAKLFEEIAPLFEMDVINEKINSLFDPKQYFNKLSLQTNSLYDLIGSLPKESLDLIKDIKMNGVKIAKSYYEIPFGKTNLEFHLVELIGINLILLIGFITSSIFNTQLDIVGIKLNLILGLTWVIVTLIELIYLLRENIYA